MRIHRNLGLQSAGFKKTVAQTCMIYYTINVAVFYKSSVQFTVYSVQIEKFGRDMRHASKRETGG